MRKISLFIAFIPALVSFSAYAAGVPNPTEGRKFAQIECGQCHVIEPGKGKASAVPTTGVARPFQTIAYDPKMSAEKIRETLRLPHGEMANVLLPEKDIDNIVSYIMTLRAH